MPLLFLFASVSLSLSFSSLFFLSLFFFPIICYLYFSPSLFYRHFLFSLLYPHFFSVSLLSISSSHLSFIVIFFCYFLSLLFSIYILSTFLLFSLLYSIPSHLSFIFFPSLIFFLSLYYPHFLLFFLLFSFHSRLSIILIFFSSLFYRHPSVTHVLVATLSLADSTLSLRKNTHGKDSEHRTIF